MKKILGVRFDFWLVVFLFLLFSTLYSLLSVVRHNHFQSQGNDFSIYDQALWLWSRFEKPYSTITFNHDLADRFRPIMVPISAAYWFSENERVILVLQAIALSAAVFPIWLIAIRFLPAVFALSVAFVYLDFVGIQGAVAFDFHEMAFLPLFMGWLFYFLEKKAWRSYFAALALALSVREHVGLIISTLGIYIFLVKRDFPVAIATTLVSLAWSILAIALVMPALGQTYYASFVSKGDSLFEALLVYLKNPFFAILSFFTPFEKIEALFWSFFSFGMLPLLQLALMPAIFFQFASRFLDLQHPVRWSLFFHYGVELAVFLSVATIFSLAWILKKFPKYSLAAAALLIFLLGTHAISNIILDAPLKNLLKVQFWREESWMDNTRFIISQVPEDASVQSQNNLLPHLSHRPRIYILPIIRDAQYLVMDLHPGQDNWNFYTENLDLARAQFKDLVVSDKYKPIASSGDAYLLKRVGVDK